MVLEHLDVRRVDDVGRELDRHEVARAGREAVTAPPPAGALDALGGQRLLRLRHLDLHLRTCFMSWLVEVTMLILFLVGVELAEQLRRAPRRLGGSGSRSVGFDARFRSRAATSAAAAA